MFKIILVVSVFVLLVSLYLTQYSVILKTFFAYLFDQNINSERLFTAKGLQRYNGTEVAELYLAILGVVYDVTRSSQHYGAGKTYNVFVGMNV